MNKSFLRSVPCYGLTCNQYLSFQISNCKAKEQKKLLNVININLEWFELISVSAAKRLEKDG